MASYNFLPGPTKLYPTVPGHIREALDVGVCSWSHRSPEFREMYRETTENLRTLLSVPADYDILFFASATEAMERTLESCVRERSIHLVAGAFGKRFYSIAEQLHKRPLLVEWHPQMMEAPEYPVTDDVEMLCFTQNETSSGLCLPADWVEKYRAQYPDALVSIDMVSSLPYQPLPWEAIDVALFSVQKGFGLPAGLGVGICSPRAIAKAEELLEEGFPVGSYHNLARMVPRSRKLETVETPNVLGIYLLGKVAHDLLTVGQAELERAMREKAAYIYSLLHELPYCELVQPELTRSSMVIVADYVSGSAVEFVENLKQQGYAIGTGYGPLKEGQIRIANFPAHQLEEYQSLAEVMRQAKLP